MARSRYEYETSPRKLEPEIRKDKQKQRKKLEVVKDLPKKEVKLSNAEKKKRAKLVFIVGGIFFLLLTISYRNSQINEKFNQVQTLKKELSSIQKENEQTKVNIANSLNLSVIEKQAKEKLGMQKLTNKQTVYVTLPKKDYVESATEEVFQVEEKSWIQNIIDMILHR